ncbi:MAG: ankyrin repeat domain-containing protein [Alphaproteobacteria bacterium]|nr:MAG: ankyrin repeat domain-containing protein [Alphaproteobacteria bacterium]
MYLNYAHPDVVRDILKAVEDEDIENLRFYIIDGADPDMRDEHGLALLHICARDGKAKAAEVLLQYGADPDIRVGTTQHTPLHYACRTDSAPMVQLLARAKATVNAVDGYGWTPLHMAADRGSYEALKEMVIAGADVAAKDREGETPRDRACRRYDATRQADHWLCAEHLRQAEALLDVEGRRREHVARDITVLKRHNPKQFRIKF